MEQGSEKPTDFREVCEWISGVVARVPSAGWEVLRELDDASDCIFLKSADSIITYVNAAYSQFFTPDGPPIGRPSTAFLAGYILDLSKHTDWLILHGTTSLFCNHIGHGPDGCLYQMQTFKRDLSSLSLSNLAILGVSRPESVITDADDLIKVELSDKHKSYLELSERDKEICRQLAQGKTTKEIAGGLGQTARTVEIRRQKIFAVLGVTGLVGMVKLLVRMQDRGFEDLGL